ncbi:hypothetical protein ACNKGR_18945 [Acinetobacter baumannii]
MLLKKELKKTKKLYKVAAENLEKNIKDLIHKDTNTLINSKMGRKYNISVITVIDPNIGTAFKKEHFSEHIFCICFREKIGLKNPYSFKPRSVIVKQEGALLKIGLEYTAQNSYGADVVDLEIKFYF